MNKKWFVQICVYWNTLWLLDLEKKKMKTEFLIPLFVTCLLFSEPLSFAELSDEYNFGEVYWLDEHYFTSGYFVIRVLDSDMNQDPNKIEKFEIAIWSDSDPDGISPDVYETGKNTGVFESNIYVSEKHSTGQRLHVLEDDVVIAEYKDRTLPLTSVDDELKILDSIVITKSFMDSDDDPHFSKVGDLFHWQNLQTGETISPLGTLVSMLVSSLGPVLIVLFIVIYAVKKRMKKNIGKKENE